MTITQTIVQNGFATLKMERIAKLMGVSRGKLYQYFPSKPAVITAVVEQYLQFMAEQPIPDAQDVTASVAHFPRVILSLITLVGSGSAQFRADLAQSDPDLAQQFDNQYANWLMRVRNFLVTGITNGGFNSQLNPDLFLIQIEATIPATLNPAVLSRHGLNARTVLTDYVQMLIIQVIAPSYQPTVDLSELTTTLQHLTLKYQQTLTK